MTPTTHTSESSKVKVYVVLLINAGAILFLNLLLAYTRNVDGDEGLYLEAARLVSQGKLIYLDFFYQQMPLIPYLYAGWMELFGFSLMSARIMSALFTSAAAWFVLWYVARRTRNVLWVTLASLFLLANGMLLAWAPVIKTHPFNALCLTASVVLLLEWRHGERCGPLWVLFAAVMIGIGVNCRLTLAPYAVVFGLFVLVFSKAQKLKNLCAYCAGLLLSSLPTLWFVTHDARLFFEYNFLYHTQIYPRMSSDEFRLKIARRTLWEPQMVLLLLGLYTSLLIESRKGWRELLRSDQFFVASIVVMFFAIHLSTATPFTQYFSAIIPLSVLAVLPALQWVSQYSSAFQTCLWVPVISIYLLAANPRIKDELHSVGSTDPEWRLANIEATVRAAKKVVKPGDYCLTWWPGYAFMVGCPSVPGMENHMREHAIYDGIPAETLLKYKMRPSEEVINDLSAGKYRVVIDGAYHLPTTFRDYTDYLLTQNYYLSRVLGTAKIYLLRSPGDDEVMDGKNAAQQRAKRKITTKLSRQNLENLPPR